MSHLDRGPNKSCPFKIIHLRTFYRSVLVQESIDHSHSRYYSLPIGKHHRSYFSRILRTYGRLLKHSYIGLGSFVVVFFVYFINTRLVIPVKKSCCWYSELNLSIRIETKTVSDTECWDGWGGMLNDWWFHDNWY